MNKKVDWDKENPEVEFVGTRITLPGEPGKMPLTAAISALQRLQKDEETILNAVEYIDAHPMDGAVAFMKAMKEEFGWASPVPTMTFFGPKPPTLLSVKTGPGRDEVIPCVWGAFMLPGVENPMNTGSVPHEGRQVFVIHGQVRKREMHIVKRLAQLTRDILARESIYKGKAIRLKAQPDGTIKADAPPEFLPTAYINPGELVLNEGEQEQIETSLWTVIRHTEACVKARVPLKRGILLEGPYGCGKTMTANVTSQVCVSAGPVPWTFILLDDVRGLKDALIFAQRYAPAVIFSEDVDRIAEHRDQAGNDLLNTIDGILSKDAKVITVLTTNYVEKLNRAMLRPGRLDAVISIKAPNALSVQRLVRIYARNLLAQDEDLTGVGEALQGQIPATVREVVERSKLSMIHHGRTTINSADLLIATRGMAAHLALLADKPKAATNAEILEGALREAVLDGRGKKVDETHELVREIHREQV